MREAEIEDLGVKIGGEEITNLRYADDTALIATSHSNMQEVVNRVNAAGRKAGLKLNGKKTKVMKIGNPAEEEIQIDGEPLENVDHFKYLGSIKSADTTCSKDIKARIAMAKQRMIQLTNIWKDRAINNSLKVKIVRALIWPVVLYGSEGWTLRKTDIKRIQSAEMWCYRRLLRVSWTQKRSNESILTELQKQPELIDLAKKKENEVLWTCNTPRKLPHHEDCCAGKDRRKKKERKTSSILHGQHHGVDRDAGAEGL